MREIKARVWSSKYKEFWYIDLGDEFFFEETDIACEFTGLLDKLGEEVYEGDIVKIDGHTFVVMRNKGGGWSIFGNKNNYNGGDLFSENCEIIGDVFENPELLPQER